MRTNLRSIDETFVPGDAAPLPILLTEDNPVNATVIEAIASRHGYEVDVATDGSQALEALAQRRYAAILMDCHMPVMDGYAATAEIRRREGAGPRMPIIALTASTMKGDRAACLAAGMDDYLAKPVRSRHLTFTLDRWTRPDGRARGEHADASRSDESAPGDLLDRAILDELDILGPYGFADLVQTFALDAGERLGLLRQCVERGDLVAARGVAHAVKGAAGGIGAGAMARCAAALERAAAATDGAEVRRLLPEVEALFAPSLDALAAGPAVSRTNGHSGARS